MRNRANTVCRVVRDLYPENVGLHVYVARAAKPDEFCGPADWVCYPVNRLQLFKSAMNVDGSLHCLTTGPVGLLDGDLVRLADLMGGIR